jgi:L-lactate dehydrogenase complex protein LldG
MTSRNRILDKVRAGIASDAPDGPPSDAARWATIHARLAGQSAHLVPQRVAGKPHGDLPGIMRRWLEPTGAHMIEITSTAELPGAIAGYLRSHNQPLRVRMGADARLSAVPWSREPSLSVDRGSAMASDTASVTHALAAVAETGTALIASGPDNPVTLSFLPETNFIVVARADIVGPLEEALARVPRTAMPRTLNLVTGPSRSADIGGIPVLGAHGPRRLCLILVG